MTYRSALFDPTGVYRYRLTRDWGGEANGSAVCFVMLNPGTADAERDDPTIRRCIGFARAWGFARLEVVNLFAYRTIRPAILRRADGPIGPENDRHLVEAVREADLVVAAWGMHGAFAGRSAAVAGLLGSGVVCLGVTRGGEPRHPLYLRADAERMQWPLSPP